MFGRLIGFWASEIFSSNCSNCRSASSWLRMFFAKLKSFLRKIAAYTLKGYALSRGGIFPSDTAQRFVFGGRNQPVLPPHATEPYYFILRAKSVGDIAPLIQIKAQSRRDLLACQALIRMRCNDSH